MFIQAVKLLANFEPMSNYITLSIPCSQPMAEIIISELAEIGFEGFVEHNDFIEAYLEAPNYNETEVNELLAKYNIDSSNVTKSIIAKQNWNQIWESSFEPVIINDKVVIKAPFHTQNFSQKYQITILPKTAFGTGHHETTHLMISLMINLEFNEQQVFDYGSGTGVLAIFAAFLGAKEIMAIDIDDWAAENIKENAQLNQINNIVFEQTNLEAFNANQTFQSILANINKNILLRSFKKLSALLEPKGKLLISGFYDTDLNDLISEANKHQLSLEKHLTLNNWCAAVISKH